MRERLLHEEITHSIIGAFYEVFNNLGSGFLEHLCVMALERELRARGHDVAREYGVRVMYKGEELGVQRLDMVVDDRVVVEVKSTEDLHRNARRQLFTYLRATKFEVGLLLHFSPAGPAHYREICTNLTKRSVRSADFAASV